VSKKIAQILGQKADYTKNRAFDNTYYMDLIIKFIEQHGQMERKEANDLLWTKLPDWMSEEQKKNRIGNMLTSLRTKEIITNKGSYALPLWVFVEK
jgi:ATP-dependent DNA helicase RecG